MPQLIHLRRLTGNNALCKLRKATDRSPVADRILRRLAVDLDQDNPRVLGAAVVRAVAQVADPRLQRGRVVLLDLLAGGFESRFAGDGGPFAGGVEEGEVDVRVGVQVVGLAGFGVGVEDEVDAVALLEQGEC